MIARTIASIALLAMSVVCLAAGPRHRDPLTDAETDQLREVAQEPDKKLNLLVKFAQARMLAIDQLRSDPKLAAGRGKELHDLLEDFTSIVDELDDNVSMFAEHREDTRKSLKDVIQAGSEFQVRLRTLKEAAASNPTAAKEAKSYELVLANAVEAVDETLKNARTTLDNLNAELKEKKK
jgi:flagellar hook-basal body complex protein FliE